MIFGSMGVEIKNGLRFRDENRDRRVRAENGEWVKTDAGPMGESWEGWEGGGCVAHWGYLLGG